MFNLGIFLFHYFFIINRFRLICQDRIRSHSGYRLAVIQICSMGSQMLMAYSQRISLTVQNKVRSFLTYQSAVLRICSTVLLVLMVGLASAQQNSEVVNIKGKLTDSKNKPLVGVTILVKYQGETRGTASDSNGDYAIKASKGSEITFSMVGYQSKTITVTDQETLNIALVASTEELSEVAVMGKAYKNQNLEMPSSNRLKARSVDVPTSTSIVSAFTLKNQQIMKPSEAFMNVAGVYQFNQGYGGTGETVGARGLSLRYQGYMFRDGLRSAADQSAATPEIQNFETIEVYKGASAINFGYTSVGAVVNYVTKKPTFENSGKISFRAGQFDFYKPSVDLNFKASDKLAIRFIGSYENTGSFRETVKSQRMSSYLAIRYNLSDKSSISFNIDQLYDKTMRDFGIPIFQTGLQIGTKIVDGKEKAVYQQEEGAEKLVSNLDRSRFLGSPFNNRVTKQYNGNINYQREINSNWNLTARTSFSDLENSYQQTGSGFRDKYKQLSDGDIEITRTYQRGKAKDAFIGGLVNLTGKFDISQNIENKISVSTDFDGRFLEDYYFDDVKNFDKITLKSSEGQKTDAPKLPLALKRKQSIYGFGIAWQNLLTFYDKINLLLSLRYDNVQSKTPDATYTAKYRSNKKGDVRKGSSYNGYAWSPALGIVYKITPSASIYGSYVSGFELNRSGYLDKEKNLLPGYSQNQFEVGAKQSLLKGKLNVNLAYYSLQTKSYRDIDGTRQFYEITASTLYKGWELETSVIPVDNLVLSANYTNIQGKYADGSWVRGGTRPQQTPEHQIGFSASYSFSKGTLKGLNLNFYGQYTGDRLGNDNYPSRYKKTSPYIQDAFTLLNLGIGYRRKSYSFDLKVANMSDVFVFNSYRHGSVNPIAPRTISLTASYSIF